MSTLTCARCNKRCSAFGSGLRFILGMQRRVCSGCRAAIDKSGALPKTPGRLVGATGKAQVQPKGKQAQFTRTGGYVEPTVVKCPAPVDLRYCIDERTYKGGEFSQLGIGRYVK